MDMITAPWTPDQVAALNEFQHLGQFHPFTCGNSSHMEVSPVLVATVEGWQCPSGCGYTQDWAPEFMAVRSQWPRPFGFGKPAEPDRSAQVLQDKLTQALSEAAYRCNGTDCGPTEQECWDAHDIHWTGTVNRVVHLDGSATAIAAVAVRVCRELGLLPPE